jgi:hypothetical protein
MGFLNIAGLRYNSDIAYVNIFNDGRFNNSMWLLPNFVLVYGFIMPCMYCILGFCSMMNVYRIINYFGVGICHTSFNQEGFQNPIPFMSETPPSPLSQTKTWCGGLGYAMEGKIK